MIKLYFLRDALSSVFYKSTVTSRRGLSAIDYEKEIVKSILIFANLLHSKLLSLVLLALVASLRMFPDECSRRLRLSGFHICTANDRETHGRSFNRRNSKASTSGTGYSDIGEQRLPLDPGRD